MTKSRSELLGGLGVALIGAGALIAVLDIQDGEAASKYTWKPKRWGNGKLCFAAKTADGNNVYLHRLIASRAHGEPPAGYVCENINGDTLDCRRANVRWSKRGETEFYKQNPKVARKETPRTAQRPAGRYVLADGKEMVILSPEETKKKLAELKRAEEATRRAKAAIG